MSRILFHIWLALAARFSTFWLQMRSLMCETERAAPQIPCAAIISAPTHNNASLCQAVFTALFSGFLLKLLSFYQMWKFASKQIPEGCVGMCVCVKCGEYMSTLFFIFFPFFRCIVSHVEFYFSQTKLSGLLNVMYPHVCSLSFLSLSAHTHTHVHAHSHTL